MSITIEVNTDLEKQLRAKAKQQGVEVSLYVSQFLEQIFPKKTTTTSFVSNREAELLQKINLNIPTEEWQLYLDLKAKKQEKTLSNSEKNDFFRLIEKVENANTERIAVLAELAQIRKTPIRVLMQQLGINP